MFRIPAAARWATVLALFVGVTGCDSDRSVTPPDGQPASNEPPPVADGQTVAPIGQAEIAKLLADPDSVEFLDEVESNRDDDDSIGSLEFVDTDGRTLRLDHYLGEQNVLLVFTRGFSGQLCPFCTTQTSRLIANYEKFQQRDTEVLLVYPGQTNQLAEFITASHKASEEDSFPFPVLLDEDLNAVKRLNIAAQLAHPSAYIIDKEGSVKLSYVGKNPIDRPSVKALLDQLDRIQDKAAR